MDQLTSLKVFCKVVEHSSFAQSARDMGMSAAMVSKHIAGLEEQLGVRLLNRTTRLVSPTEAGTAYFERCNVILEDIEEAGAALSELGAKPRGLLRVSAPMDFGVSHLVPAISDYLNQYPEVHVDIDFSDRRVNLIEEGFDLAIRIGKLEDSSLVARQLGTSKIIVCASPAYLKKDPPVKHPDDLVHHNCLGYSYSRNISEWLFEGTEEKLNVKVGGSITANNGTSLCELASCDLGIVRHPSFIVSKYLKSGQLVQVLKNYKVPELGIYAIYPHRRFLSAKVRTIVDFLAERFTDADWDNAE